MGAAIKFKFGTEAQILALTPASPNWVDLGFFYPSDKPYFYQIRGGVMTAIGNGGGSSGIVGGVGVNINGDVIGGIKTLIEDNETLNIPENYDYNTYRLSVDGVVNVEGTINIM